MLHARSADRQTVGVSDYSFVPFLARALGSMLPDFLSNASFTIAVSANGGLSTLQPLQSQAASSDVKSNRYIRRRFQCSIDR